VIHRWLLLVLTGQKLVCLKITGSRGNSRRKLNDDLGKICNFNPMPSKLVIIAQKNIPVPYIQSGYLKIVLRIVLFILSMVLSQGQILSQEGTIPINVSAKFIQHLPDTNVIQEEVMTGYSSQMKSYLTGSVSTIYPGSLKSVPSGIVTNQLQGRASGLTVIGNGQPGDISKVRIRGFSSFENNDPLYIIDGVPTQDISSLNPNDVESVSVLKDAGAASIYGSRASNGVIIVTTRKGDNGIKVTYDMFTGTQLPGKGSAKDVLNAKEYANLQWLVYKNDGTVETNPIYGPSTNPTPTLPDWAANTDWYDAITDPAGIQNYDLTLSGGNDYARFFAGLGYFKQNGIVIYTHSANYNARFNSEYTFLRNRIKVGENLTMSYRDKLGVSNLNETSPIQMGPYRSQSIIPVVITKPITGLMHNFVPGEWGGTGIANRLGDAPNVVADRTRAKDNKYWDIRLIGSAYLDVMLLKGLNFRSTLGGTWNNGYGVNYTFATYEDSYYFGNPNTPNLRENAYFNGDYVWTNLLTLDKTFGPHRILAVAGYEAVRYGMGREMYGQRSGYFTDDVDYRTLNNGSTIMNTSSSSYTPTNLASTFLKADYGFMDKYFLSASVRRDGCSRFGKSNRYGVFPSFSAAWRISNEVFLQSLSWISDLKIRGSWGKMGNQLAVSPQNTFFQFGGDPTTSYYDLNGTFNSSVRGFYPIRIPNPDVKWETNVMTDIGFETQLWNNKLGIVFDWYSKKASDLLFNPVQTGTAGDAASPYINIASMSNTGIDLELSYKKIWGDLGFNCSVVFTSYKNKITEIADGQTFFDWGSSRIGSFVRNKAGYPLSSFYGFGVTGLFQTTNEVDKAPSQDGAQPGLFRFANIDTASMYGFQSINYSDKTFIGNPNPKFTYGVNLSITYKSLDLTGFIYGSHGNDIFNWNKWWTDFWPSFQGQKSKDLLYNSWTEANKNAKVPKATYTSNFSSNTQVCSYYIEDGSYIRLKSLQIGYTIPQKIISKISIKSLRLYVQAVNLFTITRYSGLDPEIGGEDRSFGVDYGNYPNTKQFIFGLNLTL
jgi:TonB-dependent starch-binding outer membrane protein SusC